MSLISQALWDEVCTLRTYRKDSIKEIEKLKMTNPHVHAAFAYIQSVHGTYEDFLMCALRGLAAVHEKRLKNDIERVMREAP